MSGHNKWAKIARKKGVSDAKRGAMFTKVGNLISIAASKGGDPDANFQLRLAIEKAREINMPKDNIDRSIKRGTAEGNDGKVFEEVSYEVFGPAGSAFIAHAVTDNRNRTITDIKTILNKTGGNLGASGSVMWMFENKGLIIIPIEQLANKNTDEIELNLIDAGADNIEKSDEEWEIYTAPEKLQETNKAITAMGLNPKESTLTCLAKEQVKISDPSIQTKIENLYNALDEIGDINNVYTNAEW
ncbi:MAG: YebC/PmpR family DNA-binding transcriptional regulator [bacterium]